jgi:hypothetical protein
MGGWGWAKPFNEMRKQTRAEQRERRKKEREDLLEFRRQYKERYGKKKKK